jgi:hypothetical protein
MRALNRTDLRDLLVLLLVLVVMTNLLLLTIRMLTGIDLPITDAWLVSCLVLLIIMRIWLRVRSRLHSRRRRATASAD